MVSVRSKTRDKAVAQASRAALDSLGFFASIHSSTESSSDSTARIYLSSERLVKLVSQLFEFKEEENQQPSPYQKLDEKTQLIKKRSFDIAKLGLVIPFLINAQAREYLLSFVKGLVGVENFDKFKIVVYGLLGVLAGVFAYKVFKQVGDTISALRQLATITGTLFGLTEAAADSVASDLEDVEKNKKEKELEKKEADRTKKETKTLKDDLKKEKKKYPKGIRGKLSKAIDFVFKIGPKVGKGLLKALPVVGTIATIGFLLYEVFDEAVNFFSDEEKEETSEQETVSEEKPGLPSTTNQQVSGLQDLSLEKNNIPSVLNVQPSATSSETTPVSIEPILTNAAPVLSPEEKTLENEDILLMGVSDSTDDISEASEEVLRSKKYKVPVVIVNNIDNSTFIQQAS